MQTTKYVNDIFKFKEKKFDDISTIANSAIFNTRRGSMIVNGSSNLLNSDIKKNAFKSKLSFKEQPAIDSVVDSLKANLLNDNNTSDSLNTQKILGENEVLIKHKLSENSTSLQSKGHSRVSSGKNTLNGKSETITQPSAPVIIRRASEKMLTRRASEKMLTNKSLILPNYDFKRSSQKVTTIKGMFGISPNEPLNVTEKKLAMAEILNKGQNENSNRLTDKKLTDKPKTGFFGDLIKTPVIERNQRKSILTMIHKVRK